jgi:glycosyltransferase involved in cell wall biosynthesis
VIVVNDGSTDDGKTEAIALAYGDRIRYYRKENGGVSSALNYGIEKMSGKYFSWLSHDDGYSPEKIEKSIELLKAHQAIDEKVIAFTGGYFIDASGRKIRDFQKYFTENQRYSGLEVLNIMTMKGTLNGCCMLIPRSAFEEAGCFDETLRFSQDTLMWYRIFLAGYDLVSDEKPNVMNRVHGNQVSQLRRDLFSHDALVIARLLAEPLAQADVSGALLMRYIKRLTRYECHDAIDYLCNYAVENGHLGTVGSIQIWAFRIMGFLRNRAVALARKILIRFRR